MNAFLISSDLQNLRLRVHCVAMRVPLTYIVTGNWRTRKDLYKSKRYGGLLCIVRVVKSRRRHVVFGGSFKRLVHWHRDSLRSTYLVFREQPNLPERVSQGTSCYDNDRRSLRFGRSQNTRSFLILQLFIYPLKCSTEELLFWYRLPKVRKNMSLARIRCAASYPHLS
jgi:hypothetical protein